MPDVEVAVRGVLPDVPGPSAFPRARVVRLESDDGTSVATGLVVGPRLVLTTRRVLGRTLPVARVRPPAGPVTPEWLAAQSLPARVRARTLPAGDDATGGDGAGTVRSLAVVWTHPQADAALLLCTDAEPLSDATDLRTEWAEPDEATECAAVGFAAGAARPLDDAEGRGAPVEIGIVVRPGARSRARAWSVELATAPPGGPPGGSWAGCTGGALVAEDVLVGLLSNDEAATRPQGPGLQVVPARRFADQADLVAWVTADAGPGAWARAAATPGQLRRRREQDARADVRWPVRVGPVPAAGDGHAVRAEVAAALGGPAGEALHVATTTLLCGPPGYGTTAAAAAHAHAAWTAGALDLLVWVEGGSRSDVLAGLAAADRVVHPTTVGGADAEAAQAFLAWLASTRRRWLVVLDAVPDPSLVHELWPRGATGQVVVTSERNDVLPRTGGRVVAVDRLSSSQAEAYVEARLPGTPPADVARLADDLGRLPLALAVAVADLRDTGGGAGEYAERLAERRQELALPDDAGADVAATVLAVTTLAVDDADARHPQGLAQLVLILVSVLGPTFPLAVLATAAVGEGVESLVRPRSWRRWITPGHGITPAELREALAHLCRVGLASLADDSVDGATLARVHPLVQEVVRAQLDAATLDTALRTAAEALAEAWPRDGGPGATAEPVFRTCASTVAALDVRGALWDPEGHPVLWEVGASLSRAGLPHEAVVHWERLVEDATRTLGAEHLDTLTARNNLALAHREDGRLDRAVPLLVGTLEDAERVLGAAHPATLTSRNNLAMAYRDAGLVERALEMLQRNLSASRRRLGADHPDTLTSRSNLALAYRDAGLLDEALPLLVRGLDDAERVLGPDHPATLAACRDLGLTHWLDRRADRALPLLERALADRERVLGPDHPDTLTSRNDLAPAYRDVRRPDRTLPLLEDTLATAERALGPDHPVTLTSRGNLALAYRDARRPDLALPLLERMLADAERTHGYQHADTLACRGVLALAYQDAGRLDRAIPLLESTHADRQRALGPDHPDALTSANYLALAYRDAERYGDAVRLLERTLADRQRVLGTDHPDTLATRGDLALVHHDAGRLDHAIALLEGTLEDRQRVLGPGHPDTLTSRSNLAVAYREAERTEEAVVLLERTFVDRQRMLGPDHADTVASRVVLVDAYREVGRWDDALAVLERALRDDERLLGPADPQTSGSRVTLVDAYREAGRDEAADALEAGEPVDVARRRGARPRRRSA
ncbi:tetratricopeptide repeat protein [Cellulomonas fimi]|uniref:Tetratricopeptide TPR_1 repeat-containing protein n=1 Tax=Cellulomonas fimi (strain ATCC 484 / DSM 20113 / JCM 1341 / CCUG 24087 / LMG 16345 / NBRC 15513 / NCIMB 8980 / NCTC 7547 / NRS-133) TaxID=590998 RepID=F4H4Q9_CELFA|nr:tetratricopeptide repeat protein [Cellulomonas fimi]AEE44260.1 hypothetical protein Celf_0110 [Cellulomonas fimi ATCC 484]VEH25990.1 Tetratricopeptide repeat [Cellulomonas fimi]